MKTNNLKKSKKLMLATATIACLGTVNYANAFTPANLNTLGNIEEYKTVWGADGTATGGNGGNEFNDIQAIKQWNPWIKPVSLTIHHGSRIDNIDTLYGYTESDTMPDSLEHGGDGGSKSVLYLQNDEFIKRIDVCSTDSNTSKGRIGKMKVYTTFGDDESNYVQQMTFGSACNGWRYYTAPTGWHIIGFKGRAGEEIDQLEPIYAPKLKIEVTVNVGALQDIQEPEIVNYLSLPFMNDTSAEKTIEKTYEETTGYNTDTSWTNTSTFSLGYSLTQSAEVGLSVDGLSASSSYSQTVSTEFVNQFEYGKANSEQYSNSNSEVITLPIPARTFEIAKIQRVEALGKAPLDIYYKNLYTNTIHHSTGEIQKFTYDQISTSAFEVGVFVNGLIEVHPWYMNA